MKRILHGVRYDTEKATLVLKDGGFHSGDDLYVTSKGNWFSVGEGTIEPIGSREALALIEDHTDLAEKYFGDTIEDA